MIHFTYAYSTHRYRIDHSIGKYNHLVSNPTQRSYLFGISRLCRQAYYPCHPINCLFWSVDVKASHRDIQLIQRFHQAHPNIQTIFIHDKSTTDQALRDFLINLGVYSTPMYSSCGPKQIPTTILINGNERVDLNHSLIIRPSWSSLKSSSKKSKWVKTLIKFWSYLNLFLSI